MKVLHRKRDDALKITRIAIQIAVNGIVIVRIIERPTMKGVNRGHGNEEKIAHIGPKLSEHHGANNIHFLLSFIEMKR